MVGFENRNAAYVRVREYRKRRKPPFAGRHHLNPSHPIEAILTFASHLTSPANANVKIKASHQRDANVRNGPSICIAEQCAPEHQMRGAPRDAVPELPALAFDFLSSSARS
jgi:hypothetical protein